MSVVNLPLIKMADRGGKWQGIHTLKGKNKSERQRNKSIQARKNIETEYELPAAAHGLKHVDPVYMLTDGFAKRFDAVGTEHSRQMAGNANNSSVLTGENSSTGGGLGSKKS